MPTKQTCKSIALILSLSIILDPGTVQAQLPATSLPAAENTQKLPQDLSQVQIPSSIGKIDEVFSTDSGKTVILIQDAHAIAQAQKNIRNLIDFFQQTYGVETTALEGVNARLNPQFFRSFPDKELLKEVFKDYLESGELSAATLASVFNRSKGEYVGIENWDLFETGYGYFLEALDNAAEAEAILRVQMETLNAEKEKEYSAELFQLDQQLQAFSENRLGLLEALQFLAKHKAPAAGSELALMIREAGRDPQSLHDVELELKRLSEEIDQYFRLRKKSSFEIEWQKMFNEKKQAFQVSRISEQEFALFLKKLSENLRLNLQVSDRLQESAKTQKRMQDIEGTRFFDDFEAYSAEVKESLFRNGAERALNKRSHHTDLLKRLNQLEVTRRQWNELKNFAESGEFLTTNGVYISDQMLEKLIPDTQLRALLKPHLAFYENAEERDDVFITNISRLLSRPSNRSGSAVFISGGFHTQGLIERLKARGISYLLLTPSITSLPEDNPYKDQMRALVSWRDYFEVEKGKINVYQAFVRAARDRLLSAAAEDSGRLLKRWRDQIIRDLAESGELAEASAYTRFIDELSGRNLAQEIDERMMERSEKIIQGLQQLEITGQLTEANILRLFQPAGMTQPVIYKQLEENGQIQLRKAHAGISYGVTETPSERLAAESETSARPELRGLAERALEAGAKINQTQYQREGALPSVRPFDGQEVLMITQAQYQRLAAGTVLVSVDGRYHVVGDDDDSVLFPDFTGTIGVGFLIKAGRAELRGIAEEFQSWLRYVSPETLGVIQSGVRAKAALYQSERARGFEITSSEFRRAYGVIARAVNYTAPGMGRYFTRLEGILDELQRDLANQVLETVLFDEETLRSETEIESRVRYLEQFVRAQTPSAAPVRLNGQQAALSELANMALAEMANQFKNAQDLTAKIRGFDVRARLASRIQEIAQLDSATIQFLKTDPALAGILQDDVLSVLQDASSQELLVNAVEAYLDEENTARLLNETFEKNAGIQPGQAWQADARMTPQAAQNLLESARSELRDAEESFYFGLDLIMEEMIVNAVKVGTGIRLEIAPENAGIRILIDDNGPGWDIPQMIEVARGYHKLYDGFPAEDTENYGFMERLQIEDADNPILVEGQQKTWPSIVREIVEQGRQDWEIFHQLLAFKPVTVGFTGRVLAADLEVPGPHATFRLSRDGLSIAGGRGWLLSQHYAVKFQGEYKTFNRPEPGVGTRVRFWFPNTVVIQMEGEADVDLDLIARFDVIVDRVSARAQGAAVNRGVAFNRVVERPELRSTEDASLDRSELRSLDGSPILDLETGLEKWNAAKAIQKLLTLSEGEYSLVDLVDDLNFDFRAERAQKVNHEILTRLISAIRARMPHLGLEQNGDLLRVSRQPALMPSFVGIETAADMFKDRRKVFIGGPSNVIDDYRTMRPVLTELLNEIKAGDPTALIVVGTSAFGYGQQVVEIAQSLGLETVSVIPEEHKEWASQADHHVLGGLNWGEDSYYEAAAGFADAIFTVEGFGGTRREFQAFRDAGKQAFRIRNDLSAEENNIAAHAALALNPSANFNEVQTAAEWGEIASDEARAMIRAHYAGLAAKNEGGKLTALQKHHRRQDLLTSYRLLNVDGSLNYDAFYNDYVAKASNETKESWLKDYEVITSFVEEIEYRITEQEARDFSFAIHNNGYWRDRLSEIQQTNVSEGKFLLLGRIPAFENAAAEQVFLDFLTEEGRAVYANRFQSPGGYKINLVHIQQDRLLDFYRTYGSQKDQASLEQFLFPNGVFNPSIKADKLQVFNANNGEWVDLLDDAGFFENLTPEEHEVLKAQSSRETKEAYLEILGKTSRLNAMRNNQTTGMASAFALTRLNKTLSFAEMDYATAVIWRYKGHWSGDKAWEEVYQVSTPYESADFDADRLKDGPIWQAVLDRDLELQGFVNPSERFLRVVLTRTTNESKYAFISSYDAISRVVGETREALAREMKESPEKIARLALVSHDLGYWPGVQASIQNAASPALGRAPSETQLGERLEEFLGSLTAEGRALYQNRFANPAGYKLLVSHIEPASRAAFFTLMQEVYGLDKSGAIANAENLKPKDQVFNGNYGSWADLETDIAAFDAVSGPGARLAVMMKNQENNIIMTRILSSTDTFLSGMQMSHAMAMLWRYVVGDYQGEYAYDGKDRYGKPDPQGWRNGSVQVRMNYYDTAFDLERAKDYEMWSSLLIALARADGANENEALTNQVAKRSSNETESAWLSTYSSIVRHIEKLEKGISQETLEKFAPKVHDRGYWSKEEAKLTNADHALLGSHLDTEGAIEAFMSDAAREWWENKHNPEYIQRFNQMNKEEQKALALSAGVQRLGTKGYQFTGAVFRDAEARRQFYAAQGKSEAAAQKGADAVILNENVMSFDNALRESSRYGENAKARANTIYGNQKSAIATALVLADQDLTLEEMAYLTAVIWRYKGHWSGTQGYQQEWQVSRDYLMGLDRAEREKDVSILLAVYEVLGKSPVPGEFVTDYAVPEDRLDENGLPRDSETGILELDIGDRVYLKILEKWYSGEIFDYLGDNLLDGRYSEEGKLGNQFWQVAGFMARLDAPVPGIFTPNNGIFLTNDFVQAESSKEDAERSVVKIRDRLLIGTDVLASLSSESPVRAELRSVDGRQELRADEEKAAVEGIDISEVANDITNLIVDPAAARSFNLQELASRVRVLSERDQMQELLDQVREQIRQRSILRTTGQMDPEVAALFAAILLRNFSITPNQRLLAGIEVNERDDTFAAEEYAAALQQIASAANLQEVFLLGDQGHLLKQLINARNLPLIAMQKSPQELQRMKSFSLPAGQGTFVVVRKNTAERVSNELVRILGVTSTQGERAPAYDPSAEALETLIQLMVAAKLSMIAPDQIKVSGETVKNEIMAALLKDDALRPYIEQAQGVLQGDGEGNFNIDRSSFYRLVQDHAFAQAVKTSA